MALFERLNRENFNEYKYEVKKTFAQHNKKKPKSRCEPAQNLKNISKHIKEVITHNPDISIKLLSFVIYEITMSTDLGVDIVEEGYPTLHNATINYLNEKYQRSLLSYSKEDYYVKNTKRRIYDAVNVMVASKIIMKKNSGKLKMLPTRKKDQVESIK